MDTEMFAMGDVGYCMAGGLCCRLAQQDGSVRKVARRGQGILGAPIGLRSLKSLRRNAQEEEMLKRKTRAR